MKYMIIYTKSNKIVTLYEGNNTKLALLIYKQYKAKTKENVKIIKRA